VVPLVVRRQCPYPVRRAEERSEGTEEGTAVVKK
jgi:hypothetical protein